MVYETGWNYGSENLYLAETIGTVDKELGLTIWRGTRNGMVLKFMILLKFGTN